MSYIFPAIVGHPSRGNAAYKLFKQLRIMRDMDMCPHIRIDHDEIGCDYNHLAAWHFLHNQVTEMCDTEWLMVLEDDVILADDFATNIGPALRSAPTSIVSLYLGRTRPEFYQRRIAQALMGCSHPSDGDGVDLRYPWLVCHRLLSCQGVAIRRELVAEMLPVLSEFVARAGAIDQGITEWMRSESLPVAYTVPSLIDHADGPSLAQHADANPVRGPRVAWAVGGRADWTSQFRIM